MTHCCPLTDHCLWHLLQVNRHWVALAGEFDNETDATPLEDNFLCCLPDCELELGDGVVDSSVAADTDGGGTCLGGTVDVAGLPCCRSRQFLLAGGRWGDEQHYGGVSWSGFDMCFEQTEALAYSCLVGLNVDVDGSPGCMEAWLHLPGPHNSEAQQYCEQVQVLFETAYLDFFPPVWFDDDWG